MKIIIKKKHTCRSAHFHSIICIVATCAVYGETANAEENRCVKEHRAPSLMPSNAQFAVKSRFPAGRLLPAAATRDLVPAQSWNLSSFLFLSNFSAAVCALFCITAKKHSTASERRGISLIKGSLNVFRYKNRAVSHVPKVTL